MASFVGPYNDRPVPHFDQYYFHPPQSNEPAAEEPSVGGGALAKREEPPISAVRRSPDYGVFPSYFKRSKSYQFSSGRQTSKITADLFHKENEALISAEISDNNASSYKVHTVRSACVLLI